MLTFKLIYFIKKLSHALIQRKKRNYNSNKIKNKQIYINKPHNNL